ncbi:uncharacterized protein LOC130645642 isoform X1 [Hydractinia symbiolongicarpus]|uniref:uncharacterized protein LOC130645642 isoform X1 n=1 Tax=Hydractinia symbiolongicarpus TaxID=13093 RepID=UPI00254AF1A1|nr:uncharacterized protein LOC130645642 isoform X1 [Hydractinia symbiolongicarpus]XP_057307677.1 uncharacterized protein LOC130645642 isoform X1 [Hydractinia symbiolongicarpus]
MNKQTNSENVKPMAGNNKRQPPPPPPTKPTKLASSKSQPPPTASKPKKLLPNSTDTLKQQSASPVTKPKSKSPTVALNNQFTPSKLALNSKKNYSSPETNHQLLIPPKAAVDTEEFPPPSAKNHYTVLKSSSDGYEMLKEDNAYEIMPTKQNESSIYDVPVPSEYDVPSNGASLDTSQDENPYEIICGSIASNAQTVKGILPQSEAFRNYPWFDGEATPEKAQDELKRRDEEGAFMVIITDSGYLILAYHNQSIIPLLITKDEADDYILGNFVNQKFNSIPELIGFYRRHAIQLPERQVLLTIPESI